MLTLRSKTDLHSALLMRMFRPWIRDRARTCLLLLGVVALASTLSASPNYAPLRIARPVDGPGGHIHPSIAVGHSGSLTVIYGHVNHRELRILRSIDGGRTWSEPKLYPPTVGKTFYPGALTTLRDGRLLHTWNRWDTDTTQNEPRSVLYSISNDEGITWEPARPFPRPSAERSVIRHPIVELGPDRWLASLTDRTYIFHPSTGEAEPLPDDRRHGIVPIVRTSAGTLVSGAGLRSTDNGASWLEIVDFPNLKEQGWRHELVALPNGWLLASEIPGPGFGGESIRYVISVDDGRTWKHRYEFYHPGRAIGGRACPRTVMLDPETLGVVFYDMNPEQTCGPGLFFLRIPLSRLAPR